MSKDAEIEELKQRLESSPKRGKRRLYTADVKRRVLLAVEQLVRGGATESAACKLVGVHQATVSEWKGNRRPRRAKPKKSKKPGRVRPVELAKPPSRELALVLPGGARVEGLRLEQVVELVKALR